MKRIILTRHVTIDRRMRAFSKEKDRKATTIAKMWERKIRNRRNPMFHVRIIVPQGEGCRSTFLQRKNEKREIV